MKYKRVSIFTVILVCFAATIIGASAFWYNKEDKLTSETKLLIGQEMDIGKFEKNTFQDPQKSINLNNKVWAIYLLSTCEACKHQLQFAEQLSKNPASQIEIVGIMAEEESVIKTFVKEHDIKFPILIDKDRNFARSIKLKYFPSNFIVNQGKIEKVIFGSPQDKTKLSEFIK